MPATDGSSMPRGRGTERNPLVGGAQGGGGGYGATTDNNNSSNHNHGGHEEGRRRRRQRAVGFTETLTLREKMGRWLSKGGKLEPFRLLKQDMRNLRGRYWSDWNFFNQLVLASAVYVFFTNILPGITFASDLYALTGQSWGTVEVVFSTGLCGLVFSLFSAQPLTILGVTGPFSVLAENLYELSVKYFHVPFLPLMAWSLIHAGWMHVLLAVFNAHDWTMQYVTEFSSDIFSLLNSVIYFHKAYKQLSRIHDAVPFASFLYSVLGAFGTCFTAVFLATAVNWAPLFGRFVRMGLTEYAAALSIMLWIAVPYMGELSTLEHHRLPVQSTSFRPTNPDRDYFFVEFWKLPVQWVLVAIIPGAIITVLYYFDHEISSIICTMPRYGVRKPGGYAWDVALLGLTTAACGIMGIPPANGLLPQAPLHSESLRYLTEEKYDNDNDGAGDADWSDEDLAAAAERRRDASGLPASSSPPLPPAPGPVSFPSGPSPSRKATRTRLVPRTHEQRYSHFLQAALILAFVSPPLQRLLGLTPTSVLAGLFLFMGYESLSVNPILPRLSYLLAPPSELGSVCVLPAGVSWLGVHMYTLTQVVVTLLIFGVTLTVAAPTFPLIIIAFVPIRLAFFGRFWGRETLRYVDGWACREGKPEDEDELDGFDEFGAAGDDDDDSFDDDLNRGRDAGGGQVVSGRKGHDNLVDLERDAVVSTNGRGGGSGQGQNGRRRTGHV